MIFGFDRIRTIERSPSARFAMRSDRRIQKRLKPAGTGAREADQHGLSAGGAQRLEARGPDELGAETVGDHQSLVGRQDALGKVGRDREREKIAIVQIVPPLVVSLEVGEAGFDFDDGEPALMVQRHHVGATSIGERKLEQHGLIGRHQRPSDPALEPRRNLGTDRRRFIGSHRRLPNLYSNRSYNKTVGKVDCPAWMILEMSGEVNNPQSSMAKGDDPRAEAPLDAIAVELATGLSIADVEALGSDRSPEVRAEIAVKFAREFDRLAKGPANKLTGDLLDILSRDRERLVRMRFAQAIKTSPHLPSNVSGRLARDEIDIAAPILLESPVLDEAVISDIIKTMPEAYSLVIAERQPLSGPLVDDLIEHKGTKRVVVRLLDNGEAELCEAALLAFREWGRADPDIADRLQKRPNLPFAFVNQQVVELTDQVQWRSLGDRTMTKFEATRLQSRFEGKSGQRFSPKGQRFRRVHRALKTEFERGHLKPSTLLAFLRDQDIDQLECGFTVITGLDLRWVRTLLYGGDRRGLIALCLKADFSAADYLAFRMALTLAEHGTAREQPKLRYPEKNMQFARDQFERMRAEPHELKNLLPPDVT